MRRQKGGEKWKQGSDGCIFLPSVACAGDTTPNPANTISKIIPKGSVDETVEASLEKYFPHVVNGKGVLIAQKRCTPIFKSTNLTLSQELISKIRGPCFSINSLKPELYTNFVTERYDNSFFFASQGLTLKDTCKLLRCALNAAVALTPDKSNTPWILGYDFHSNNIFVKNDKEPYSSLADWGRIILIENHSDLQSIQKALSNNIQRLINAGVALPPSQYISLKYYESYGYSYNQKTRIPEAKEYSFFPLFIRASMDKILESKVGDDIESYINVIRLTNVYGILNGLREFNNEIKAFPSIDKILEDLLGAFSQEQIIQVLNYYFTESVTGFKQYIDIDTLFPQPSTSAATTTTVTTEGPIGAGAGAGAGTAAPTTVSSTASQTTTTTTKGNTPRPHGIQYFYMGGMNTTSIVEQVRELSKERKRLLKLYLQLEQDHLMDKAGHFGEMLSRENKKKEPNEKRIQEYNKQRELYQLAYAIKLEKINVSKELQEGGTRKQRSRKRKTRRLRR